MRLTKPFFFAICFLILSGSGPAKAQNESSPCAAEDRACIHAKLENTAQSIENKNWQGQIYRELAKSLAADGKTNHAITLIKKIENPDTRAMTIRGIGMAAAQNDLSKDAYSALFTTLRAEAENIAHPPSYAIALTYIAMAQAFAGDNEGAWKTASDMENSALRNKAYAETAEIQAERGDFSAAMNSIEKIDTESFQNKAYAITSKILADQNQMKGALQAAMAITNSYKKAQSLQNILNTQAKLQHEQKATTP